MNPLIGASLVGLGGSIIGGLGTMMTNHQNVQAQERINQAQLDFAREQTEREFSYNSIGAQMKRAMEAGLNPMVFAGANPTHASSSSTPSIEAPVRQNPFASVPASAMSIGNAILQNEQLNLRSREIGVQEHQLDLAEFQNKTALVKTILDSVKGSDLTSSEVEQIINDVFSTDSMEDKSVTLPELIRDAYVSTDLRNKIEVSDIDTASKRYLYFWLDEMTYVDYMQKTSQVDLTESQKILNKALTDKENAKVREIDQAIKNMRKQIQLMDSQEKLNEAELDKLQKTLKATVDNAVALADINEQEAQYWIWKQVISNPLNQSFKIFGVGGSKQDLPNRFDYPYPNNPLNN